MDLRIALAGNPNSGKTTLFNALTGSNQFVGNCRALRSRRRKASSRSTTALSSPIFPVFIHFHPIPLKK